MASTLKRDREWERERETASGVFGTGNERDENLSLNDLYVMVIEHWPIDFDLLNTQMNCFIQLNTFEFHENWLFAFDWSPSTGKHLLLLWQIWKWWKFFAPAKCYLVFKLIADCRSPLAPPRPIQSVFQHKKVFRAGFLCLLIFGCGWEYLSDRFVMLANLRNGKYGQWGSAIANGSS